MIDEEGIVYLGGNYGLTYFKPREISFDKVTTLHKTILKSLYVSNKIIAVGDSTGILNHILNNSKKITLNKDQNSFSIEFHSFNYLSSTRLEYAYTLEGLNSDWIYTANKDYAYYNNLDPGEYTFKVKSKNEDGIWSDPTSIKIVIKQSKFLTTTAYIIYLMIIIISGIMLLLKLKKKNQIKLKLKEDNIQKNELNKINEAKIELIKNTSNEIITVLTIVKGSVDRLSKEYSSPIDGISNFKTLKNNTQRLLNLINKLIRDDKNTPKKDITKNLVLEKEETNEKNKNNLQNSEKPTILLVESDKELSDFIGETLRSQFSLLTAHNGDDGLSIAKDQIPDLIISDIESSETDNSNMWTFVKNDELISHIPIILLSSNIDPESKIESYKQGIDAYISKPFDIEILPARINNLIAQRRKLNKSIDKEVDANSKQNFSSKVKEIISTKYSSPELNVNYLADSMNMSRTSFYRKFIENIGVSPKDYITKFRINKAIEMIEEENENMGNISFMCGFASQSNFSVAFKREKGETPLKYKKRPS